MAGEVEQNHTAAGQGEQTVLDVIRAEVGPCREWIDEKNDRCNAPAEYVLWGKLIDPEGLGPRCWDHAAQHVGPRALGDRSWAIIDLRRLTRALYAR
jgi:hypothetical protein